MQATNENEKVHLMVANHLQSRMAGFDEKRFGIESFICYGNIRTPMKVIQQYVCMSIVCDSISQEERLTLSQHLIKGLGDKMLALSVTSYTAMRIFKTTLKGRDVMSVEIKW